MRSPSGSESSDRSNDVVPAISIASLIRVIGRIIKKSKIFGFPHRAFNDGRKIVPTSQYRVYNNVLFSFKRELIGKSVEICFEIDGNGHGPRVQIHFSDGITAFGSISSR